METVIFIMKTSYNYSLFYGVEFKKAR